MRHQVPLNKKTVTATRAAAETTVPVDASFSTAHRRARCCLLSRACCLSFAFSLTVFVMIAFLATSMTDNTSLQTSALSFAWGANTGQRNRHLAEEMVTTDPLPEALSDCENTFLSAQPAATTDTAARFSETELADLTRYSVFSSTVVALELRRQLSEFFTDDGVMCRLALLYLGNCREMQESVVGCVRRIGAANLAVVMPRRCRRTGFFAALSALVDKLDASCGVPAGRPRDAGGLSLGAVEAGRVLSMASVPARLQSLVARSGGATASGGASFMGRVLGAGSLTAEEHDIIREAFYLPPESRPQHRMPSPLQCGDSKGGKADPHTWYNLYSMGFALPKRPASMTYPANKLFEFFPISPSMFNSPVEHGDERTEYVLTGAEKMIDEWVYAVLLRYSMFGFTHKRGGWDCLRHAEHLYYGAVPVFADLPASPSHTPSTVPRKELLEVLDSPMLARIGQYEADRHIHVLDEADPKALQMMANGEKPPRALVDRTPFVKRCHSRCNIDFRRPGELYLEPYRAEHEADIAAGRVRPGTPLTFRAPVVQRYYEKMARPLWDLVGERYTAGGVVNYLLESVGHLTPRRVLVIGTSMYDTDYMHETVVSGFSELGIPTETLVRAEADKRQSLSFVGAPAAFHGVSTSATTQVTERDAATDVDRSVVSHVSPLLTAFASLSEDPREVGIAAVEERVLERYREPPAFTSAGRYNPFLARRFVNPHGVSSKAQHEKLDAQVDSIRSRLVAQRDRFRDADGELHDRDLDNVGNHDATLGGKHGAFNTPADDADEPFDLVVYTVLSVVAQTINHHDLFLMKEVLDAFPRSRILFIDHNDQLHYFQDRRAEPFSHYGSLFVREMEEKCFLREYVNYGLRHRLIK